MSVCASVSINFSYLSFFFFSIDEKKTKKKQILRFFFSTNKANESPPERARLVRKTFVGLCLTKQKKQTADRPSDKCILVYRPWKPFV